MPGKPKSPLISVIVPIYNTDKYLDTCLSSIVNQTYKNLEIILVDDGSTDNSLAIAARYKENDSRIKLISQKNSGVAAARNNGVSQATGSYVIHADSDDQLPESAIGALCDCATKSDADMVIADYIVETKNNSRIEHLNFIGDKRSLLEGILSGRYHASLCNKLLKRSLYDLTPFEPGINVTEDKLFICRVLSRPYPIKISYISHPVYVYKKRAGSYTTSYSTKSDLDQVATNKLLCSELNGLIDDKLLTHLRLMTEISQLISNEEITLSKKQLNDIYTNKKISRTKKILTWLAAHRLRPLITIGKKIKFHLHKFSY